MTDCSGNACPQSRRAGEERRRHHRRADDHKHLQWCARTVGGVVALTAIVSVGASASISALITSNSAHTMQARLDAIRMDVNEIDTRIMRLTTLHPAP